MSARGVIIACHVVSLALASPATEPAHGRVAEFTTERASSIEALIVILQVFLSMGGTTLKSSARRTYLLLGVKSTLFELPYSIIKLGSKKKVVLLLF